MNTINGTGKPDALDNSNPPSTTGDLVSATTGFAMRSLIHQRQVDFFAEAKQQDQSFEELLDIVSKNTDMIRNKTLYDFLRSRNPSKIQIKQLNELFRK